MLHKYGLEHPLSGMHQKVKRIPFKKVFEIVDPATREIDRKEAKDFMISQTSILLDRDQLVLSPFDDMIWKQMMDYQVIRISQNGKPVYTSENEHALDAFMLTILGFTIEFPQITKILEEIRVARKAITSTLPRVEQQLAEKVFGGSRDVYSPQKPQREQEARDNPHWHWNKVSLGYSKAKTSNQWGSRGSGGKKTGFTRSKF